MTDLVLPPYKIKTVEKIRLIPKEQRLEAIKKAGYNVFLLKSEDIFIDLLTDSGTNAMSDEQWSAMMRADESYAGSKSFFRFESAVQDVLGFEFVIPVHQGRAAEKIFDAVLVKPGDVVPGNHHFDTTQAHIEYRGGTGINCVIQEAFEPKTDHPFKGNMDIAKLEKLILEHGKEKVPYILVTITCNSVGGQPVSMENIRKTKQIADKYGIPLFFDAARFSENAFLIKKRETDFFEKPISEIVHEMMSYADGCLMSAKKDANVNMGGFIAVRDKALYEKLVPVEILMEGFPHYGGMSGRDVEAVAVGLREAVQEEHLAARIGQVAYLAERLEQLGVPIIRPVGGHAVYVDGKAFLPHVPQHQFPSQALCTQLYIESGIRAVEIGTLLAGRDPKTNEEILPQLDLMRLTIPRRVYLKEHMDYVAESIFRLFQRRNEIGGVRFVFESPILRHFQSRFELVEPVTETVRETNKEV